MKPLIGVNMNQDGAKFTLDRTYWEAVAAAGGVPVPIAPIASLADLDQLLESLDGLLLTGGADIDPARYGEKPHPSLKPVAQPKHDADFQLAARALEFGIPTLGICYGMQLLSVLHGGTLVQDIPSQVKNPLVHWLSPDKDTEHPVRIEPGTRLHALLGSASVLVNSHHHQSVATPGSLAVTARAEDGVVEAVESKDRFVLGVQWHPERMKPRADMAAIFQALVAEADRYRDGSGFDVTFVPQR